MMHSALGFEFAMCECESTSVEGSSQSASVVKIQSNSACKTPVKIACFLEGKFEEMSLADICVLV
jgi:hypothetical protein